MGEGRTLVTATPPTPNGALHLGHISGPYSGADMLVRAERLQGREARLIVGIDDHQSYVAVKALNEQRSSTAVAETYADEIERLFEQANIATGPNLRSHQSDLHQTVVHGFFAQLLEAGRIEPRTEPAPFCPNCERYLFEAYVAGDCQHCGEDSDGNQCEACARPNSCIDLGSPRCNLCGATPENHDVTRLILPLSQWSDRIGAHLAKAYLSPQLTSLAERMLGDGLPDIPVTHPTDWGLPAALPGVTDQRFYVWAEMAPGYIASTVALARAEGDPAWENAWLDPSVRIVQFFGFDNAYFHLFLHAGLMLAWNEAVNLPAAYVTNEFYELEGSKFSTSRRHAIWASELLDVVPTDVVRFVLAVDRPETARTNFDRERFEALADDELAAHWSPWLGDLLARLAVTGSPGAPPDAAQGDSRRYLDRLDELSELCLAAYTPSQFSPQLACRLMTAIEREGERLASSYARERSYGDEWVPSAREGLRLEFATAARLAQLAAPIMPDFAAVLWRALGMAGDVRWTGLGSLPVDRAAAPPAAPFFSSVAGQLESLMPQPQQTTPAVVT